MFGLSGLFFGTVSSRQPDVKASTEATAHMK